MVLKSRCVGCGWAGRILILVLLVSSPLISVLYAQRSSYPKIASFNWAGARPEWYAKFDLVIMWKRDETARYIKNIDRNVLVLPTQEWTFNKGLPEEWAIRDGKGNIISSRNTFNMLDMTDFCPKVNGQTYQEYLLNQYKNYDFSLWDGISTDWLWVYPWSADNGNGIDLDRNGVDDLSEHGRDWVQNQWLAAIRSFLVELRNVIPQDKIIFYNPGGSSTYFQDLTNGKMMEKFPLWGFGSWPKWFQEFQSWMEKGRKPSVYLVNGHGDYLQNRGVGVLKENYRFVRWGLASVCMGDGYYNYEAYFEHWYNDYYDEYDLDLGLPKGPPQRIRDNLYARFFDRGAVIVNGDTFDQTVDASDLVGLDGYAGPYYHFVGNQNPDLNNGSRFSQIVLKGDQIMGDGVFLLTSPDTVIAEIIIDNAAIATLAGQHEAAFNGSWNPGFEPRAMSNPFTDNPSWTVGPDWSPNLESAYRYRWKPAGDGSGRATYRAKINVSGNYAVFEWHGWIGETAEETQEATNMPYTIYHSGGSKNGTINLQTHAGRWNYLGTFYVKAGDEIKVVISDKADGPVIADAFKFINVTGKSIDTQPPQPPGNVRVFKGN